MLELNKIHQGDNMGLLKQLPDNSVDSIVTDPPYGLSFMGKKRDYDVPTTELWRECLRVLKPGGHLLAFAGTRTQHRMAVRIEDAGFEIRDMIAWVYGSGFPKSLNIGKSIDKLNGRGIEIYKEIGRHIKEKREQAGYTLKQMNEIFGYVAGCNWWESQNDNNTRLINLNDWIKLIDLIGVDKKYTEIIERIEAEREILGQKEVMGKDDNIIYGKYKGGIVDITKGNSEREGRGTALKPALEPITLARKPIEGTVAENVLKWGTGGLNIDESRVEAKDGDRFGGGGLNSPINGFMGNTENTYTKGSGFKDYTHKGRFPANLIHDNSEEVRECFPDTKTNSTGEKGIGWTNLMQGGDMPRNVSYGSDSGNASRFFKSIIYQAKASKSERNMGCEELEEKDSMKWAGGNEMKGLAGTYPDGTPRPKQSQQNNHPTVKPIALMEYLIKMVTKKGGIVLDPFMGSGTTGMAAKKNGYNFVGMEMDEGYCKIAEARINAVEEVKEKEVSLFNNLSGDE